jgi:hypothetical protein
VEIVRTIGISEWIYGRATRGLLQALPFGDRNKHGGLDATARNNLRPLVDGGVQEFAEAGFRVGYGPGHWVLQMVIYLVIL